MADKFDTFLKWRLNAAKQALNWPERQFMPLSLPQYAAIKYRQYQANQQTLQHKKKVAGNNLTVLPIDKEKKTVRTN